MDTWERPLIRNGAAGKRPKNKAELFAHPLIADSHTYYVGKRDTDTPEWVVACVVGWTWGGLVDHSHYVHGATIPKAMSNGWPLIPCGCADCEGEN